MIFRKTLNLTKNTYFHCKKLSSYQIRQRFLEYFIAENAHSFIHSSPVVPLHDQSLAFVNAGMNQFKDVFLNNIPPPCLRVANSQKCIRVGGKHNDLKDVGRDTYHHTFFEMLGNWSFGNYFKHEACELAWRLLTAPPYCIHPRKLYVTYFSGCGKLGLPPDLETKEIWQSLGVETDHILGFGVHDNLWEMGSSGPCGPCTEIHLDSSGYPVQEAAKKVNMGYNDVTELWNIVFIQYNRNDDGSLSTLPCHHVDTGMGFERLVAHLQDKRSNYDTDLFIPLFDTITKSSKAVPYRGRFGEEDEGGLDTAYRMLADHSRMTTVAVADNMFPDHSHKLRRVMHKALLVAEDSFRTKNAAQLMKEVCSRVADTLSSTYPEVGRNLNRVHTVVDHEWEVMKVLRGTAGAAWRELVAQDSRLEQLSCGDTPGLCAAYHELTSATRVSGDLAFHLYDTHGIHPDTTEELAQALGLEFDETEFNAKLSEAKSRSVYLLQKNQPQVLSKSSLEKLRHSVPTTNDSDKYNYKQVLDDKGEGNYVFPQVQSVVQAVIRGRELVEEGKESERVALVLNRTCLYYEAGGQEADRGLVVGEGWTLDCDTVLNCGGYILHIGTITPIEKSNIVSVQAGNIVCVRVEEAIRLAHMRNHTATHILNGVLHQMFAITHQKGSSVTHDKLIFSFAIYGQQFTKENIAEVDRRVQEVIRSGLPVTRSNVSASELSAMEDITLLPGETYPSQNIHIIQIVGKDFLSKEACCGTHVLNTADIEDWCMTAVDGGSVTAVTGEAAKRVRVSGQQILKDLTSLNLQLQADAGGDNVKLDELECSLQAMKKRLSGTMMPQDVRVQALAQLKAVAQQLKDIARKTLRQCAEAEMREVLRRVNSNIDSRYLVHRLLATSHLDNVPLQKITRMCPLHMPVLIFSYAEGQLKARCCVPKTKVSQDVTAEGWLGPVLEVVGGSGAAPRGQDPHLIYNMRPLRVMPADVERVIGEALAEANRIAIKLFQE